MDTALTSSSGWNLDGDKDEIEENNSAGRRRPALPVYVASS